MKRRDVLALLGGAAIWPLPLSAQQPMPLVGVLLASAAPASRDFELIRELAQLGYQEGRNIRFEILGADGNLDRLPSLARELVAKNPNAIVGSTSAPAIALAEATRDIPIVMTVVGDPIALGLSTSMSRPDRNVTGFTVSSASLAAKRLELLRELIPALRTVGYLWVPGNPLMKQFGENVRQAGEALGIKLISLPMTSGADIPPAFATIEKEQVKALLIELDPLLVRFGATILDEALLRDLPTMVGRAFEVHNGALMSYGPAVLENYPRTAIYIDRILKGAKISELPFEEPSQVKLAINLRTARSIGLTVPPALIVRADEVVE